MALVKHNQINFLHFQKSMHQQVIEFFSHSYKDIVIVKLFSPCLKFRIILATFLLAAMISPHNQVCVALNRSCLLFNQRLHWYNKKYFLPVYFVIKITLIIVWLKLSDTVETFQLIISFRNQIFTFIVANIFIKVVQKHCYNMCLAHTCF